MTLKKMKNFLQTASGLACIALASCSGASQYMDGDAQKRNEVEMVRIPFILSFDAEQTKLSAAETERLDLFMMRSNVAYGDELSMDFPLMRNGSLSEQNTQRLHNLSTLLKKRGLRLAADVTPYGRSPDAHQARLLISRYVVTPPRCGDWSEPSTNNFNNAPLKNLGCASQAQLGLMVANPKDLITGVSNNLPNAEQAANAVAGYKTKTKAAAKGKKK